MKFPKPTTIDFETLGIDQRPKYPPVPVGVSIKQPGQTPKYWAWGHPTGNNCGWDDAKKALVRVWIDRKTQGLLFQNGKFDIDVGVEHFGLTQPKWSEIHDTMFLLYLDDPHQIELGLKPSAARLLNMPADEQDAVGDWLVTHQPIPNVKVSRAKNSDHYFGRYIAYAPGDLVGKYANGDTIRTEKLFTYLWPRIVARGMLPAYDRERQLMPILLEMERNGVQVKLEQLQKDITKYVDVRAEINQWIIKTLRCGNAINLDSGPQLVEAMIHAKKVDLTRMPLTPTGKVATNKEALTSGVIDIRLRQTLLYRAALNTCLDTFMTKWRNTAESPGALSRIFTSWNQVKSPSGDHNVGTRTGRLSSTPSLMNIPLEFPETQLKLPPLPRVRSYVTPFPGEVLIDRDYSQQEVRIMAHFESGKLMRRYTADPWTDFHDFAQAELARAGRKYDRKIVKNTNLGLIYGMGVGKLAMKNNLPVSEAGALKDAILDLYPGLKELYRSMRKIARAEEPIYTWGEREYHCEPPQIIDGRTRTFDYKLVNVLIQGSAADCTKEAIIRFDKARNPQWRLILNVHDQLTASVPKSDVHLAMRCMKECMEGVEFDVPMLTEGSTSDVDWDHLKPYDKKGKQL